MSLPLRKTEERVLKENSELPFFSIMTRVLIRSLCPVLKSELMFGDIESVESGEKFDYWIDAILKGDIEGSFGVVADRHTLKTLALHFKIKTPDGKPNEAEAIAYLLEALAKGLEEQFKLEDFHCELKKGSGILRNHQFNPPKESFYFCPVETKCGPIKIYFSFKPSSAELVEEMLAKPNTFEPRKIRVFASQLDTIFSGIKDLETLEEQFLSGSHIRAKMRGQIKRLKRVLMQLKSESLETLFTPARKLVVDISKQQGKQIRFISNGTWLCLDKTLLNHLYEPILHLIRNAVDHGIEEPMERERLGKSAYGNIRCRAAFNENGLRLVISDDGKGLDVPKIRERAIAKGILTADIANTTIGTELCELIFKAGFSTREHADAISGRGLGLDIVKKGIEMVGGTIKILSTSHHGTSFEICIPLNPEMQTERSIETAPSISIADRELEDKGLLVDELTGYFERLNRALIIFNKERTTSSAYEAYRLAHSIKGAAGFLGWNRVASYCHNYEELLKLVAEEKASIDDELVKTLLLAGEKLQEFCDASKGEETYSLFQVRRIEASILQAIWAATNSDERTHLFVGKYHLNAIEKILAPQSSGRKLTIRPEIDFTKAIKQPFGALVQYTGDRRGYAGILLPEETFVKMIHPLITGTTEKSAIKRQIWSLREFGKLMGQQLSEIAAKSQITLQESSPITYYGWGQPLKILGDPTYCYACEIDGNSFYLAGDFRMAQEMVEMVPIKEPSFHPELIMHEAVKQCQKHFLKTGLPIFFSEQSTQSDLIGFDGGITAIIACKSPGKNISDSVLFLSYEAQLADHIHQEFCGQLNGKIGVPVDLYDCLNETSNIIGGLLIAELEKRKMELSLSLPTVFIGKAYVANFNSLFIANKVVGTSAKGKCELQILVT